VFVPDDRTGNVLTTVALFAAVLGVAYAARTIVLVFILSMLFVYLLEPSIGWLQRRFSSCGRTCAIAQVYLLGTLLVGSLAYGLGSVVAGQIQQVNAAATEMVARLRQWPFFDQHSTLIAKIPEHLLQAAEAAAPDALWLLAVPAIAVFVLSGRQRIIDSTVDIFGRRRDRTRVRQTVERIDTMLAQYIRAQLTLAGLSFAFYTTSMALLGFPYAIAFGLLGGAFEFLPVVGWLAAAALILAGGVITHAHWIWMAGLLGGWRIVQNLVNSPRIMVNAWTWSR
jgi:predicted PurR-regulated permease PerM